MAQVPYDPVPQGAPGPLPTEGPRVDTPGAAFGTNIGEAIQRGGAQVGQAGNELFQTALQIQNLKNETDARNQAIDTTQKMAERFAKYNALGDQEKNEDALKGLLGDLNTLRLQGRAGLNPMAARFYDAEAANLQNSFTKYGALESGRAIKNAAYETAGAHADLISNQWVNPLDEKEASTKKTQMESAIRTRVMNSPHGWDEDTYKDERQKALSGMWVDRVGIIGRTNPDLGFEMLDRARKANEILPKADEALYNHLLERNKQVNGDILARNIVKQGGTMEEQLAKAEEMAPQFDHGEGTNFLRYVQDSVRKYNLVDDQIAKQQKRTDQQAVLDAIHNGQPQNEKELFAQNPGLDMTYQRAQSKGAFPFGLANLIKANFDEKVNAHNVQNWQAIDGLRFRDPAKFLDVTADLSKVEMDKQQRGDLLAKRKQMIANPMSDPAVPEAMSTLKREHFGEMKALGVLTPPPKDADPDSPIVQNYDRFLSTLGTAIDQFRAKEGRSPFPQEFEEKIAKPLLKTHPEGGFMGWYGGPFGTDRGQFNQAIPKEVVDNARESMEAEAKAMGMPVEFTEREVYKEIQRKMWKEFFAGQTESPGGGPAIKPK